MKPLFVAALCALAVGLPAVDAAAPGDPGSLDLTFGGMGTVSTPVGDGAQILALAIQPDGKIVAAGPSSVDGQTHFGVVRYLPDGALDTTFGGTGKVITGFTGWDSVNAVAVQADGKIVVAGSVYHDVGAKDIALIRYEVDGRLDTTFGGTGFVITAIDPASDENAYAIAIQEDGKIVAAGVTSAGTGQYVTALVRYDTDGTLDTTFGGTGLVTTPGTYARKMVLAAGKIVVAGDGTLARYEADGTLDTTFGGTGVVGIPFQAFDLAIQGDGKIVTGGRVYAYPIGYEFALVRTNSDGSVDTSFGAGGTVVTDIDSYGSDDLSGVAIQADGKIVAAGASFMRKTYWDFAVARYRSDGVLDDTFGRRGTVTTAITTAEDTAYAVAIQPDGKIVVAGTSYSLLDQKNEFAVARYLP